MAPARAADAALTLRTWALEAEAAGGIAKALAPTAFVPENLRVYRNPRERDPSKKVLDMDGTVQQVAAVLLAGQELDLKPMASLRSFCVIRGNVAMYAIATRALLQRHGHEVVVVESTGTRAVVRARRADSDQWQQATWDTDRARIAGLLPGTPDSNWRKQPKAMLVARATAEVCRWVASDAMLGLPLIAEELADAEFEIAVAAAEDDGRVVYTKADEQPPPRKRSTKARAALPSAPLPVSEPQVTPAPPPPPPATQAPEETAMPTDRPSKEQLARLHAGLRDIGVNGKDAGLALISEWTKREVSSTRAMTAAEVSNVIEHLDALRTIAAQEAAAEPDDPGPADEPAEEAADVEADGS